METRYGLCSAMTKPPRPSPLAKICHFTGGRTMGKPIERSCMKATLEQSIDILTRVKDKLGTDNPRGRLQDFFDSGLLSDLLEIPDPVTVDRDAFRRSLKL